MGATLSDMLKVVCALFVCFALALASPVPLDERGAPKIPCLTQEVFESRRISLFPDFQADCATQGSCDDPTYRADHYNSDDGQITLNMVVHIMNSETGQTPDGVTVPVAEDMMTRVVAAYGSYGINIQYSIVTHENNTYYCIPGYSSSGEFISAIDGMKEMYAVQPDKYLNVFISCMQFSIQGTLYGIATFPWDRQALRPTGGLWLNGIACNQQAQASSDSTFEHELGHCLGLWHTFHGSDEVFGCNFACEEFPHSALDPAANTVGDFCSDTPATPRDYECANPGGTACNGAAWGSVDYTNYMGYGMDPEPCGDHFTDQQKARMHCWTCDALSSLVTGCPIDN